MSICGPVPYNAQEDLLLGHVQYARQLERHTQGTFMCVHVCVCVCKKCAVAGDTFIYASLPMFMAMCVGQLEI